MFPDIIEKGIDNNAYTLYINHPHEMQQEQNNKRHNPTLEQVTVHTEANT
jgi:hypothetical protein